MKKIFGIVALVIFTFAGQQALSQQPHFPGTTGGSNNKTSNQGTTTTSSSPNKQKNNDNTGKNTQNDNESGHIANDECLNNLKYLTSVASRNCSVDMSGGNGDIVINKYYVSKDNNYVVTEYELSDEFYNMFNSKRDELERNGLMTISACASNKQDAALYEKIDECGLGIKSVYKKKNSTTRQFEVILSADDVHKAFGNKMSYEELSEYYVKQENEQIGKEGLKIDNYMKLTSMEVRDNSVYFNVSITDGILGGYKIGAFNDEDVQNEIRQWTMENLLSTGTALSEFYVYAQAGYDIKWHVFNEKNKKEYVDIIIATNKELQETIRGFLKD